jgi:hypothetical protein
MDDHKFEEFIKGKIGEYEDPEFDPAALADFHHRMAAINLVPWYVRYSTVLWVTSALIVFTIINFSIHWTVGKYNYQAMQQEIATLKAENREIKMLANQLKALKKTLPDTIRITEVGKIPTSSLSASVSNIDDFPNKKRLSSPEKHMLYLGSEETIPTALLQQLLYAGFIKKEGQDMYLTIASELLPLAPKSMNTNVLTQGIPEVALGRSNKTKKEPSKNKKREKGRLSARTIRALEKQNQKGIGINVGPTLDISQGVYPVGEGAADLGGGILGEFVLSPSLSIESGVKYMYRNYHIDNATDLESIDLPDFDETLGNLEKAKIRSQILEFPVNLKYRYPFNANIYGLVGTGYSSILYLRQNFEYGYSFNIGSWDEDLLLSISEEETEVDFSAGALNFSLGISRRLKNNHYFELLMYYQHNLGKMGEEEIIPDFFGVRGTYWWKIR